MTSSSSSSDEQSKRTQAVWRCILISAARTALACIIVGCITLYGPAVLRQQVGFPSFSYVTVILIVTNATLGDTIRGCWYAVCATVESVGPAILCLSIVGPTRLTGASTALVVAINAFFIALPEWTHVVAKRIALGQVVLLYVIGYINGESTHPIMHPVHVAASTAVGAVACVLALFFPYPRLACSEVKQNSKLFAENVSVRLKLFVKAFSAEDVASSQALISQAKCLAANGGKFLQCIRSRQESMHWERFPLKFFWPYCENPGDLFQELDTPLRGMEIALSSSSVPISILDEELEEGVNRVEGEITRNLELIKSHLPCETSTVPESNSGLVMDVLQDIESSPSNEKDLPSFFFLFCMKLLYTQSRAMAIRAKPPKGEKKPLQKHDHLPCNENRKEQNGPSFSFERVWANWPNTFSRKRVIPALKCSLSLGFAVLIGLCYSKPNGFWAGLPVAISLAAAREATFKVTNVKAQGTVLGSVYGVLGCFVFERYVRMRFLALLPWFVFSSFLQQSKMYGQAGGVSAVIGAVLILGRANFGPPSEFAIARIVETVIGLACSVMVELMLQPTRAASLAKAQLTKTLDALHESLASIDLHTFSKDKLFEREKQLKISLGELKKFVEEAEVEPNFWFLPFHSACYWKLLGSLTKMVDLLLFAAHATGSLEGPIQKLQGTGCQEELDMVDDDLQLVMNMTSSSLKCLEKITSIKSLQVLEKDLAKTTKQRDVEMGTSRCNQLITSMDDKETRMVTNSFLDHSKGAFEKLQFGEDENETKNQVVVSYSALGFCLSSLMKETREVEKAIKELVQWENPASPINLSEISRKVQDLHN